MASSKLVLRFGTLSGEKTWTFSEAKDSGITVAQVKNLMDVMIANGSIYQYPPLSKLSAKLVRTSEDVYNLAD